MTEITRARRASIYLNAARKLERKGYGGCCEALSGSPLRVYDDFANVFKQHEWSLWWWPTPTSKNNGPRVLALCFMAAMVETGDA